MRNLILSRLSPFRHADYRAFFFVQTLSLIGQWSHDLARAWIVIELMGRAGALGSLMLAIAIPSLFFTLQGGVLVDRINVKKLMIITKLLLAALSLLLATVVEFGSIQFWHLLIFGLIEGCIVAFDTPAYQALTVRLVPRKDFQQALALNSTNFHGARMLGPLVAGGIMAVWGPAAVFLLDALTYIVLVLVLRKINLLKVKRSDKSLGQSHWQSLWNGLLYIQQTPAIRYKILQLILTISLIFPLLMVVFRTYVQAKFDLNAEQFGYIFTFPALGSMLGALSFTILKPHKPVRALLFSIPSASFLIYIFPHISDLWLAAGIMSLTGFFMYLSFAALTVSLHLEVEEDYRGRLGSVIGLCFLSIGPLMSFPIGLFADFVGFEIAIHLLAVFFLIGSAYLAHLHGRLPFTNKKHPHREISLTSNTQTPSHKKKEAPSSPPPPPPAWR